MTRQLSASYSRFSDHSNETLKDLFIDPEVTTIDTVRMQRWANEFVGLSADMYCYSNNCDRATASTIVSYPTSVSIHYPY